MNRGSGLRPNIYRYLPPQAVWRSVLIMPSPDVNLYLWAFTTFLNKSQPGPSDQPFPSTYSHRQRSLRVSNVFGALSVTNFCTGRKPLPVVLHHPWVSEYQHIRKAKALENGAENAHWIKAQWLFSSCSTVSFVFFYSRHRPHRVSAGRLSSVKANQS